jgi:hypothetical protein
MVYWAVRYNNIYYNNGFGWLYSYAAFKSLYEPNDKRFEINHWYEGVVDPYLKKKFTYREDDYGAILGRSDDPGANFSSIQDLGIRKWAWCTPNKETAKNPSTGGFLCRNTPKNFPIIRYSEVILMRAELLNEVNNGPSPQAYDDINKIRNRAGLEPLSGLNKESFLDAVYKERQLEFVYECKRWWDLARRRVAEKYFIGVKGKERFNPAKNYTWPYPTSAVDRNKLMDQKTGW